MATKKTYYIVIDSYWATGPDWFVGPFATPADAEAEIERALNAPDSKVQLHDRAAVNVWDGIRIWGIIPKSAAVRAGMKLSGWGKVNLIGKNIPITLAELKSVVAEIDRLE